MTTHTYPFIARLIYRWANIPLTIILIFYLIVYIIATFYQWYYIIAVIFELAILYFLNRHYIRGYKLFPYKISIDNEKMICENFFFSKKSHTIYHSDISKITGSIFSGNKARPLYIYDEKNNVTIGLRVHLNGYNQVLTKILSNVSKELYDSLLEDVKAFNEDIATIRDKRQKKKKPVD